MLSWNLEMQFLILQYLREEGFKETFHKFEQESGIFFNMKYFEEKVLAGKLDDAEKYLLGFTMMDDNSFSFKLFFEIRKQKYFEALDRGDKSRAFEILLKDLKIFQPFHQKLFKEITQILTLDNFRENKKLSKYGDTKSERSRLLSELKEGIQQNPVFQNKLIFPTLETSRLQKLIKHSFNWQHHLCENPSPNPNLKTLFTDHTCSPPSVTFPPAAVANPSTFAPLGAHGVPFPPAPPFANGNALPRWMVNANPSPSVQSSNQAIEARTYDSSKSPLETKVFGSSLAANINPIICKVESSDRSLPAWPAAFHVGDSSVRNLEKQRSPFDVSDKSKPWQLTEIVDPSQCRSITLPDSVDPSNKVSRLLYTHSGAGLLALGSKGIQKLWKWNHSEQNPGGKAPTSVPPHHWQPDNGLLMTNDVPDGSEEAVPCIALSKNDAYVMSACRGKISLFDKLTFKVLTTFMRPPPPSTFLVFHPLDNNIFAIGMEDSIIHMYNVNIDKVIYKLKGHMKRITGITFSTKLNILVSSGADAQICFWSIDSSNKKNSFSIPMPFGMAPAGDTRVQFHSDQVHLLVCHETQLAIYDASTAELIRHWVPQDSLSGSIASATYSCNSQQIYASFTDGNIGVFDADTLRLKCRIAASSYLPQSSNIQNVYPLVVAAHPQYPNQLAVGLTDGSIKVLEPLESEGRWGVRAPIDNSWSVSNNSTSERLQRRWV